MQTWKSSISTEVKERPLNRLLTAAGPTGHLSYTIDAFGNKSGQTMTSGTGPSPQGYQVAANNALTGNGLTYDQAGNVTFDGFHSYPYDVEGRLYKVDNSTCYIYDGDGDRVARTNCNVSGVGSDETSLSTPVTDDKGTTHFTVNNEALNGLNDLPGAPKDSIKTTINMDVTADGKVGIEGGVRTAYPSMEVYSYDSAGQSKSLLQVTEHNPSDLANQNQPIPQVAPQ